MDYQNHTCTVVGSFHGLPVPHLCDTWIVPWMTTTPSPTGLYPNCPREERTGRPQKNQCTAVLQRGWGTGNPWNHTGIAVGGGGGGGEYW